MAQYKNQHYVPQSYQEAWLDPDTPSGQTPWVWVFPKDGGEPRRKAPIKLYRESDFYTVRLPDGGRDVQLEKDLGLLDGDFASLRRDVLEQKGEINPTAKARLAFFTAAMSARVLERRDHWRGQWQGVADLIEMMTQGAREEAERGEFSPGPFSHWTDEDFASAGMNRVWYDPDQMRAMLEQPMPTVLRGGIAGAMPFLLDMHLTILCTTSDPGFITSDAPCVLHDWKHGKFFGMGSESLEITLPLSPRQAALFSWVPSGTYREVPDRMVQSVTLRTRTYAYREFISQRQRAAPVWFGDPGQAA